MTKAIGMALARTSALTSQCRSSNITCADTNGGEGHEHAQTAAASSNAQPHLLDQNPIAFGNCGLAERLQ